MWQDLSAEIIEETTTPSTITTTISSTITTALTTLAREAYTSYGSTTAPIPDTTYSSPVETTFLPPTENRVAMGSGPTSATTAIIDCLTGMAQDQSTEQIYEQIMASGSQETANTSDTEVAILLAGSYFILKGIHEGIKAIYSHACYQSDPRLVAVGYRPPSTTTRLWGWTARALEICWAPLWFTGRATRTAAVNQALDDTYAEDRIRNRRYVQFGQQSDSTATSDDQLMLEWEEAEQQRRREL